MKPQEVCEVVHSKSGVETVLINYRLLDMAVSQKSQSQSLNIPLVHSSSQQMMRLGLAGDPHGLHSMRNSFHPQMASPPLYGGYDNSFLNNSIMYSSLRTKYHFFFFFFLIFLNAGVGQAVLALDPASSCLKG